MGLGIHQDFFSTTNEVLDDVKKNGMWPTTYVSGQSEGLHVHWHEHDVHAYIVEGETDFLDGESGIRTPVSAGDKVVVTAKTLHAEGPVRDRVVYILAVPQPLPPEEFLTMHDPDDLNG